jgi:hypothetical protein
LSCPPDEPKGELRDMAVKSRIYTFVSSFPGHH